MPLLAVSTSQSARFPSHAEEGVFDHDIHEIENIFWEIVERKICHGIGFKRLTGIAQTIRDDLTQRQEQEKNMQLQIEQMKLAQAAKHREKPTSDEIRAWACLQAGAPVKLSYSEISTLTGRKKGTIQAYVNQYRKQHKDNMENTTK